MRLLEEKSTHSVHPKHSFNVELGVARMPTPPAESGSGKPMIGSVSRRPPGISSNKVVPRQAACADGFSTAVATTYMEPRP